MLGLQACVTTFSNLLVNSKTIKENRSQTPKEKKKMLVSLKILSLLQESLRRGNSYVHLLVPPF